MRVPGEGGSGYDRHQCASRLAVRVLSVQRVEGFILRRPARAWHGRDRLLHSQEGCRHEMVKRPIVGGNVRTRLTGAVTYKSPLHQMTQTTPTCLWNDSADIDELRYAIENGAVGATCNPVIALGILKKEIGVWKPRIQQLMRDMPGATEDQIGWKLVEEMSVRAAELLEPAFAQHSGRNGRLSIQTDPRLYRNTAGIFENVKRFAALAPNMIVKIPVTKAGIAAIEEATALGISI